MIKINKPVLNISDRKLISVFLIAVVLTSFSCRSKTIVKKLSNVNSKTETKTIKGSIYHLPLTVIKVSIPFKVDKQMPGKFGDFAPCFFDEVVADRRIKAEKTMVSVEKPTFSSFGTADLEETFVVQTTGKYFESRTISLTLNKEGVLTEGKIEVKDETLPIAIKIAETVISLGTKALSAGLLESNNPSKAKILEDSIGKGVEGPENCYVQGFGFQFKKAEKSSAEIGKKIEDLEMELSIAQANNDKPKIKELKNKIEQLKKGKQKIVKEETFWAEKLKDARKTWKAVLDTTEKERPYLPFVINLKNAQKAKEELDELLLKRSNLQEKIANYDPEVYKNFLKELDDKIKPLNDSFAGKGETFSWNGEFEFNPAKNSFGTDQKTLITYSKTAGICNNAPFNTDLIKNGILVAKEFQTACDETDDLAKIQIYADRLPEDQTFISNINAAKRAMENITSGWYFRIPAKTQVVLVECQRTVGDTRCLNDFIEYGREKMMIAQYGAVVSLPAKTAGRSSTQNIVLDEATGALKNFTVSSSPLLDKSTIDDAGKTAEKVVDANDPLTKKKRELDLLKTQNEINTERQKLENPSPTPTATP